MHEQPQQPDRNSDHINDKKKFVVPQTTNNKDLSGESRLDALSSAQAEKLFFELLNCRGNTQKETDQAHKFLDRLESYFANNLSSFTVEVDENDEQIRMPDAIINKSDKDLSLKHENHTKNFTKKELAAAKIFENLRQQTSTFSNYLVQLHIKELLNGAYQYYVLDQSNEDEEEMLAPRVVGWFSDVENDYMQYLLNKDFGVEIKNFSPEIRNNFFNYLDTQNIKSIKQLKTFTNKFGNNGLKSFLAAEVDDGIGDDIVNIGEKLDLAYSYEKSPVVAWSKYEKNAANIEKAPTAELVFKKIGELIDLAELECKTISSLAKKNESIVNPDHLRQEFLKKAYTLISELSKAILSQDNSASSIGAYLKKIVDLKKDIIILSSILRAEKKSGQAIDISLLKDLEIIKPDETNNLSEQEKTELINIQKNNYQQIFLKDGAKKNPAAYKRVSEEFVRKLDSLSDHQTYILKYKDEIVAFCIFERISEDEVYGSSLNVNLDLQGLSVGNYFIEATLKEVSEHYSIKIKSRKDNPANNSYRRNGFKITSDHREADGVEYYDLILPAQESRAKAA